ncbi:hypothetical protein BKA70DRAFT_1201117 [Coprinopsis sp. MPI-PUGE-AT-0042]|nr:hypothetical protein BKA70DRAFT_1201117 [Coprinopsis sp. MPI-PUGE-AT-0042]
MASSLPSTSSTISLRAIEGAIYEVNASVLIRQSGLFRDLLSLPQPEGALPGPVDTYETDEDLRVLLQLLHGSLTPSCFTFQTFTSTLRLAEKWDFDQIIGHLRLSLMSTLFIEQHPLETYALACHFEWADIAKKASAATLSLDLEESHNAKVINDMFVGDALALRNHRQRRCDLFEEMLDSPSRFPSGNSEKLSFCDSCCKLAPVSDSWKAFKVALNSGLKRDPSGQSIESLIEGNATWMEAEACWMDCCPSENCNAPRFDRGVTLLLIKACLEALPISI